MPLVALVRTFTFAYVRVCACACECECVYVCVCVCVCVCIVTCETSRLVSDMRVVPGMVIMITSSDAECASCAKPGVASETKVMDVGEANTSENKITGGNTHSTGSNA